METFPREAVIAALAAAYNYSEVTSPSLAVATLCDEVLDPSGRLLGEVREAARKAREKKEEEKM